VACALQNPYFIRHAKQRARPYLVQEVTTVDVFLNDEQAAAVVLVTFTILADAIALHNVPAADAAC
jgi:hypothetical protein